MSLVLSVNNIQVSYEGNRVLESIHFNLQQGEILGLLGASGCGKTTLLNVIAGFVSFQQGDIFLDEIGEISSSNFIPPEQRKIGMIFQDYALFPHLTMVENIGFGIKSWDKARQQQQVERLTSLLKLNGHEGKYPHQLSGGQQQRVAIARALATEPKLLLLDEPFSNIDARLRHDLMQELRVLLKELSVTAIFVTHNKEEVFTFADQMAVMHDGHILQMGSPIEVCQSPKSHHVADFLQLGNIVPIEQFEESKVSTQLGNLICSDKIDQTARWVLVKPSVLQLNENAIDLNATVEQVTVSENGFKVHAKHDSGFVVILYCVQAIKLGQRVNISMNQHEPILLKEE